MRNSFLPILLDFEHFGHIKTSWCRVKIWPNSLRIISGTFWAPSPKRAKWKVLFSRSKTIMKLSTSFGSGCLLPGSLPGSLPGFLQFFLKVQILRFSVFGSLAVGSCCTFQLPQWLDHLQASPLSSRSTRTFNEARRCFMSTLPSFSRWTSVNQSTGLRSGGQRLSSLLGD